MIEMEIENEINRNCSLCDKELTIVIGEDNSYIGGHYFGVIEVIRPYEYWECEECYNESQRDFKRG